MNGGGDDLQNTVAFATRVGTEEGDRAARFIGATIPVTAFGVLRAGTLIVVRR